MYIHVYVLAIIPFSMQNLMITELHATSIFVNYTVTVQITTYEKIHQWPQNIQKYMP